MSKSVYKKLCSRTEKAFMEIIYDFPMLSQIAMSIGGVTVLQESPVDAVAHTDGKGIYLNAKYLDEHLEKDPEKYDLDYKNIMFIICHEILHLMTLTIDRLGNKNPRIWNMATDYAINDMLITNRRNDRPNPMGVMPKFGLYDPKYHNMSAEQIYEDLMKEFEDKQNETDDDNTSDAQENGGFDEDDFKTQKQNGYDITLDKHLPVEERTIDEINQRISDALKSFSPDKCSAFDRILKSLPEPKFPWRARLLKYLKSFKIYDTSWSKPSRRSIAVGAYLPKPTVTPELKVTVAVDTSGSISEAQLENFMDHVVSICKQFRKYKIRVFCFSTHVHKETEIIITPGSKQDLQLCSYGGTSISSAFQYVEDTVHEFKQDIFICMTDGYDRLGNLQFSRCPVIWAITKDRRKEDPFIAPEIMAKSEVIYLED